MALINCPECGKEISDKAASCPNCGNPINQPTDADEYLACPKCNSSKLHAENKGFSGGKALAGVLIAGEIGLLAGTHGSQNTQITCLKCGYSFKAGDALIIKNNQSEDDVIRNITKSKGKSDAVRYYKETHNTSDEKAKEYVDRLLGEAPSKNAWWAIIIIAIIIILYIIFQNLSSNGASNNPIHNQTDKFISPKVSFVYKLKKVPGMIVIDDYRGKEIVLKDDICGGENSYDLAGFIEAIKNKDNEKFNKYINLGVIIIRKGERIKIEELRKEYSGNYFLISYKEKKLFIEQSAIF